MLNADQTTSVNMQKVSMMMGGAQPKQWTAWRHEAWQLFGPENWR
jgi:hypothetical protein